MEWKETILSQYSNSPRIKSLIEGIANLLDPTPDIELFYRAVFNPATCYGKGIEIWKRIVAATGTSVVDISNVNYFGYNGEETNLTTFDINPFYFPATSDDKYQLSTNSLRAIIMAKAMVNVGNATIGTVQKIVQMLLNSTQFSVTDGNNTISQAGTMTVKIVILGIRPVDLNLLKMYMPKVIGGGVKIIIKHTVSSFFGFKGTEYATPLGQGLLYSTNTQWNEEVI